MAGVRKDSKDPRRAVLKRWAARYDETSPGDPRSKALEAALRGCAEELRGKEARPFFSTREIAEAFRVSLSVVSSAYRTLRREGLLRVARGSETMLAGTESGRSIRARGLTGMIVSLESFLIFDPYRAFFLTLRRELRMRGFLRDMIFVDGPERDESGLLARVKNWNAAVVLFPDTAVCDLAGRLADSGLSVVALGDEVYSPVKPRYRLVRSEAVSERLEEWKTEGIQSLVAVAPAFTPSVLHNERVASLLHEHAPTAAYTGTNSTTLEEYLRALQMAPQEGIVFAQAAFTQAAFQRAPEVMFELIRTKRVLLPGGPPTICLAETPAVRVDLVLIDWETVARTIATDIEDGTIPNEESPTLFHAKVLRQVNLCDHIGTGRR